MGRQRDAEVNWEKRLGISTLAADFEKDDAHHSRYEPTPYAVLERLAGSGWLKKDNLLVDYGCGKGRVGFYLSHAVGLRSVGVEYSPSIFRQAQENLAHYAGRKENVSFVCENAEGYAIGEADCFYFFNPFSLKILQTVLGRILAAYYEAPREMKLFFYYPLDDALSLLMTRDELEFAGEIDCRDLFHNDDPKERILIFRLE